MEYAEVINWWDVEQQLFPDALLPEVQADGSSSHRNELPGLSGLAHVEEKSGTSGSPSVPILLDKVDLDPDFASWMDEKMDLTVLDDLESCHNHLDDPLVMDGDTAALLASWIEEDPDLWSSQLPVTNTKNTVQDLKDGYDTPPYSPECIVPDLSHLPPKQIELKKSADSLNSHLDSFSNIPSVPLTPKEPSKYKEENIQEEKDFGVSSFLDHSSPFAETGSENVSDDSPAGSPLSVQVTLSFSSPNSDISLGIQPENSRRYKPYGLSASFSSEQQQNGLLKSRSLKAVSGKKTTVDDSRKQRKRVQNKDAATRYRVKKKAEGDALQEDETVLLNQNQALKDKVQQISSEITYLKGLMRELFKARGLLK